MTGALYELRLEPFRVSTAKLVEVTSEGDEVMASSGDRFSQEEAADALAARIAELIADPGDWMPRPIEPQRIPAEIRGKVAAQLRVQLVRNDERAERIGEALGLVGADDGADAADEADDKRAEHDQRRIALDRRRIGRLVSP